MPASELYVSAISIFELELGVLLAERRDQAQGRVLRTWLESYVGPAFAGKVLAVDAAIARRCAALHVPDPRPQRDAWIAATALIHEMTVVTRNIADFGLMGVKTKNPWGQPQ